VYEYIVYEYIVYEYIVYEYIVHVPTSFFFALLMFKLSKLLCLYPLSPWASRASYPGTGGRLVVSWKVTKEWRKESKVKY
jgi:hypothetical protein